MHGLVILDNSSQFWGRSLKTMFIDHIRVHARAGDGGNGVVHFFRGKFNPKGGPDGGDGGDGGSVILQVDSSTDNLKQFFYDPKVFAEGGQHGRGAKMTGKKGKDLVVKVPPGTLVWRSDAESLADAVEADKFGDGVNLELVADLLEVGERFVLCQGGQGGKGNWHFKSSTNQAPQEHTLGTEGDEAIFYFELRRIADAGLVGFPNAGKSTLLGQLSEAKPKVGNYPFTTLTPSVGVVEFGKQRRCTVADVPGLIEGAHDNRGLGHEFLRHLMRCEILLFVVDISGFENRDPIRDLELLRTEVKLYDEMLSKRRWFVLANKMDLDGAEENLRRLRARFPKVTVIPMIAELGEGVDELKAVLDAEVGKEPPEWEKR